MPKKTYCKSLSTFMNINKVDRLYNAVSKLESNLNCLNWIGFDYTPNVNREKILLLLKGNIKDIEEEYRRLPQYVFREKGVIAFEVVYDILKDADVTYDVLAMRHDYINRVGYRGLWDNILLRYFKLVNANDLTKFKE